MDRGAGYPSPTRMEQGEGLAQELPQVPGTPSQRSGQSQQSARLGAQENGPIPQQTIPGRNMSQQGMTPGMFQQGFTQQQRVFRLVKLFHQHNNSSSRHRRRWVVLLGLALSGFHELLALECRQDPVLDLAVWDLVVRILVV